MCDDVATEFISRIRQASFLLLTLYNVTATDGYSTDRFFSSLSLSLQQKGGRDRDDAHCAIFFFVGAREEKIREFMITRGGFFVL